MKSVLFATITFLMTITGNAQILSQFSWDSNPISKADVGPDAIAFSAAATSSPNGKTGNGLNAGNTRADINFVLPGATFNVMGIDISIDFRREESEAQFFTRSNNGFVFGMHSGQLYATYQVTNGGTTAPSTITSGNVYAVPSDKKFHTYRFRYDDNIGIATISVDGTNVFTTTSAAATMGKALYWQNAGNVSIGILMDGNSSNVAILDNLLVQAIPPYGVLPLKLLSFTAALKGSFVAINWSATQEANVARYIIERSADGIAFSPLKSVSATNLYTATARYQSVDSVPLTTVAYYRLKMMDFDGTFSYSAVQKVSAATATISVSCFPNPAVDYVNVKISSDKAASYFYRVSTIDGKTILAAEQQVNSGVQLVSIDLTKTSTKGILLVQLINKSDNTTQTFKLARN